MTDEKEEAPAEEKITKSRALVPYENQESKNKSILDSITAKWLMWIITALVVPVTLTSLYNGVSTLNEHSRILAGIQVTLNDIKNGEDQFNNTLAQLGNNERQDQTDIAVLKSEIENPPSETQIPEHRHFQHQKMSNPVEGIIDNVFKPIGKAFKETARRNGR